MKLLLHFLVIGLMLKTAVAAPTTQPSYRYDVAPILTRLSCATAACHGGARSPMRLSLFSGAPEEDCVALAKRINHDTPAASLLVQKITGQTKHGGGALIKAESPEYQALLAWIAAGAPLDADPKIELASVSAGTEKCVLRVGQGVDVRVRAVFSDQSARDVSTFSNYRSTDGSVATVDQSGHVIAKQAGQAYAVATYCRKSAIVRVVVTQTPSEPFPAFASSNPIDRLVVAKLREIGIPPSDVCTDEVFLRRAFLDTIGTLPTAAEAKEFLASQDPDERTKLIDHLLGRDEFNDFLALKWGDLLRIKAEYPVKLWPKAAAAYYRWVRQSVASNQPYDRFVTDLLVSSGSNFRSGPANFYRAVNDKTPADFAESAALLFMGVRLSCARCHVHPTESWTHSDDQKMAAFFAQMKFKSTQEWKEEIVYVDPDAVLKDPATTQPVQARFFDGTVPQFLKDDSDPRQVFAKWLTSPQNPWFARNISNRVWSWLMGRGIVNEPDDVRPTNPPSNPALLDLLAKELVAHHYDIRYLFRLILTSRTYQLSSQPNADNIRDTTFFSHYVARRLPAEVLLDAISQFTGTSDTYTSIIPEPYTQLIDYRAVQLSDGSVGNNFLELFGRPSRDTPLESERCLRVSSRQALFLLNSAEVERKIASSGRLKQFAMQRKRDGSGGGFLDELFLAGLSRYPTPAERQKIGSLLAEESQQGQTAQRGQAAQDMLWAIINSEEFLFNH